MKQFLFLATLLLPCLLLQAQSTRIFLQKSSVCHIEGHIDLNEIDVNTASPKVQKLFEDISTHSPYPANYVLYRCNNLATKLFAAVDENGQERIIVYDEKYLAKVMNQQDEKWAVIFTIAHEVGHHAAEHTLKNNRFEEDELKADYFAGYIMGKMGANQSEVMRALEGLTPHPDDGIHPPKSNRIDAVINGWTKARKTDAAAKPCPNPNKADLLVKNNTNAAISLIAIQYEGSSTSVMLGSGFNTIGVSANSTGKLPSLPVGTHILSYGSRGNTYHVSISVEACGDNRVNIND